MRIETASAWILASLCLLAIAIGLYVFDVPGKLTGFFAAMGVVYFGVGALLIVIHDRHMAKHSRAGWE